MGVSARFVTTQILIIFRYSTAPEPNSFRQIYRNVFYRTSAKYLDTFEAREFHYRKHRSHFAYFLKSQRAKPTKHFFYKYFFPRVAEFHSWSGLLDYGLLFGDILQHNFHFYINDSFLSKLTILTSFSQKKNKQTNKQ